MNKNEIVIISEEILKNKMNEIIDLKNGIENMVYKMVKGSKTLIGYNKETLKQLTMELGLREIYSDLSTTTIGDDAITSVRLELIDNNDRVWTTSYGSYQLTETPAFRGSNERIKDFALRGTQLAQKRALNNAITPFLIKLGLDYSSIGKNVEITTNADDFDNITKVPAHKDYIDEKVALKLYNTCLKNELVFKTTRDILLAQGIANIEQVEDLSLVPCKRITKEQFKLIEQAFIKEKAKGNK